MTKKYFPLGATDNNRLVRIIQVVFGIVCFALAIFWVIFNLKSLKTNETLWITVIFLSGFGFYEVWAGLGLATRFIEINYETIRIKKSILLSAFEIHSAEIEKIEIYPFNLIFFFKSKKRIVLRLGASYQETNEKIKDEIMIFAELKAINVEFVKEQI